MAIDSPLFDAALALPQALRADLAARLIESLDNDSGPAPDPTQRSDAIHFGQAELVDGQEIADMLQAIADRESRKS